MRAEDAVGHHIDDYFIVLQNDRTTECIRQGER